MENYNEISKGNKVWIYSRANPHTIELSNKLAEKKAKAFLEGLNKFESEIENVESNLDAFLFACVISYDSQQKIYLCEYIGEFRDEIEDAKINFYVDKEFVYKADDGFGYKDNSQLRNLNIGNVIRNIQVCYDMLKGSNNVTENNNEEKMKLSGIRSGDDFPKYPMYSFAGGILIAVNPYKEYDIYNDETAQEFIGKNIMNMEPHPFAIAEWTYRRMLKDNRSQSIIISGESGAGKTETSKHVLKYLSYVSNRQRMKNGTNNIVDKVEGLHLSTIENCLLSSNPLLEVFGNSRTIRNDNSSRFGKYMKLGFDENGKIINASINTYLLAKSRVVHLPNNERNYHIFYHILNEINETQKTKWGITCDNSSLEFNYLKTVDSKSFRQSIGKNSLKSENLREIMKSVPYNIKIINDCFQSIGVSEDNRDLIYDMIYTILLLGNIEFNPVENKDEDECELSQESISIINQIVQIWNYNFDSDSDFSKMSNEELIELLTTKSIMKIKKRLSYSEAIYTRDSISRYLYEWIFNLIVELINIALKQNIFENSENSMKKSDQNNSIGILDIFGFEDLEPNHVNSFEQLLINYCNERLHSFFLEQLLYRDTVLYKTEGINNSISTTPSANVMDLLFHQSFVCTVMSGVNPKYLNSTEIDENESRSDGNSCTPHPFYEKFQYNNSMLSLLPYNIISILDETGKIPMKGNRDHAFCNKVHSLNKLQSNSNIRMSINRGSICNNKDEMNTNNLLPQLNDLSDSIGRVIQIQKLNLEKTFTINHFAGPVKYTSNEFISKNTDFLSGNIEKIIHTRINTIQEINKFKYNLLNRVNKDERSVQFKEDDENINQNNAIVNDDSPVSDTSLVRKSILSLNGISNFVEKNNLQMNALTTLINQNVNQVPTPMNTNKNKSVSSMFVRQVQNMLINELYPTQSHFIRCIKPNNQQISLKFDSLKVYKQLQIGGILQILNIMIYGYPCRIPYSQIYNYFKQIIEINTELGDQESMNDLTLNDKNNILFKAKLLLRDERLFVSLLLEYMGYKDKIDYQLGLTRVFFKFNVLDKVEQFIQKCDQENSMDWKIECINSLYKHWLRKKCNNYLVMIRCSIKFFSLYRHIKRKNACIQICKALRRYVCIKREERERIEREERERIEREERERIEREERERIERERIEREERERIEREERERIERERIEREERERIERERIEREEKERIERERIEREEKERIERERIEKEEKEKSNNEIISRNSSERKVKRSRNEFTEDIENDTLYLNDHLKMNNRKKAKANTLITQLDEPMELEETGTSISNHEGKILPNNDEEDDETDQNNSPLLCTSTMRGQRKRYSIYYMSGNNVDSKEIEGIKSLQDELVEAEFIDDVLKEDNIVINSDDLIELENVNNNNENEMNNSIKTGIKRPTVFIPNSMINIKQNNHLDSDIKANALNANLQNSETIDPNSKKISLKDVQENFRNNIMKQRKQQY
ncbi:Myosin motor domain containing protein [Cryptosporidium hominis]|uniref:Myosin motor domain containing protein n=1 Tax=Cryptosporidium hominis TaxID=237895 RepID=A0ABX5B9U0_CRYHO|nr:Myosin motor domain containing protein [Cryptosporidium hominis]|eukprot:PPS92666.1 Myosin motor domain containing protein [Cryptosporidium hominis]